VPNDPRRSLRLSSLSKPDGTQTQDPDLSQDLLNDTEVVSPARELHFSPPPPMITTDDTGETSSDDDDDGGTDGDDDTRKKMRLSVVNEGSVSIASTSTA
jgi:hypothetical protein